jgi:hypothetical protein
MFYVNTASIQIHFGDLVRGLDAVRYTQVSFVSFCAAT